MMKTVNGTISEKHNIQETVRGVIYLNRSKLRIEIQLGVLTPTNYQENRTIEVILYVI